MKKLLQKSSVRVLIALCTGSLISTLIIRNAEITLTLSENVFHLEWPLGILVGLISFGYLYMWALFGE